MLSPHHGGALGHITLLARALLHFDSVRYRMAMRRMLLIPHQLRVWYKRAALASVSGSTHFVNLAFRLIKMYLMSVPVVSIWRKSDQFSARYDQKPYGAGMLSTHHSGAVGHIRF